MSARYLTFKFDIHGGGIDLIFPHHENEIAQNPAACQESCVRYWMHNGHVTINNEKMSKSSGSFLKIRQVSQAPALVCSFKVSCSFMVLVFYASHFCRLLSDIIPWP